jgi:hypothetical protein
VSTRRPATQTDSAYFVDGCGYAFDEDQDVYRRFQFVTVGAQVGPRVYGRVPKGQACPDGSCPFRVEIVCVSARFLPSERRASVRSRSDLADTSHADTSGDRAERFHEDRSQPAPERA